MFNKKVVFIFGRFQVPTKGHAEMIRYGAEYAKRIGAEFRVYTSKSWDAVKNPLPYQQKLIILRALFPGVNVVDDPNIKSAFDVCRQLSDQGVEDVTMITGGDRVAEFKRGIGNYVMDKHSPKFDKSKHFAFTKFNVINSGNRKPGVSGTTMRDYIRQGKFKEFASSAPTSNKDLVRKIYATAKSHLKENELNEVVMRKRKPAVPSASTAWKQRRKREAAGFQKNPPSKQKLFSILGMKKSFTKLDGIKSTSTPPWSVSPSEKAFNAKRDALAKKHNAAMKKALQPFKKAETHGSTRIIKPQMSTKMRLAQIGPFVMPVAMQPPKAPIYKNPTTEQFDKLAKKRGLVAIRVLYDRGDWYFWDGEAFIHAEVIKHLKLSKNAMQHMNDVASERTNGMLGIQLYRVQEEDNTYSFEPTHDIMSHQQIDIVVAKMKSDKKFNEITKNFKIYDVHERAPSKASMDMDRLRAKVQRDIDLNLAEGFKTHMASANRRREEYFNKKLTPPTPETIAKRKAKVDAFKAKKALRDNDRPPRVKTKKTSEVFNIAENPWLRKNPTNADFNDIFPKHKAVRMLKMDGAWYLWDAEGRPWHSHGDVIRKITGDKWAGDDVYRVQKGILGFTLEEHDWEKGTLVFYSDAEGPMAGKKYFNILSKDRKFRSCITMPITFGKFGTLNPIKPRVKKAPKINQGYENLRARVRDMEMNLAEELSRKDFDGMLQSFVDFSAHKLNISNSPEVAYKNPDDQGEQPSFAAYAPGEKKVYIMTKNRHPMDIFRSVAHELVHHKQNEDGKLGKDIAREGATGSHIEDEANYMAGRIMREYGKANRHMFSHGCVTEHKAIILGGVPGSGKDKILKETVLPHGFREISDVKFTEKDCNGDNIVINGNMNEYSHAAELKDILEEHGYEVMMMFVNTSDEVSRERNEARGARGGRVINETVRFAKWNDAQNVIEKYKDLFEHFMEIRNDFDLSQPSEVIHKSYAKMFECVSNDIRMFTTTETDRQFEDMLLEGEFSDFNSKPKNNPVGGAGNWGTPKLTDRYKADTPGQTPGPHQDMKVLSMDKQVDRWVVKEQTRKMFKAKYGKLAEQKLKETAKRLKKESLDDPFSPSMGMTPNSWNQEDNRPGNGTHIDAEKKALFGMKFKKRLNKK